MRSTTLVKSKAPLVLNWLVASRKFENWFEGDTPTTNPNLNDEQA